MTSSFPGRACSTSRGRPLSALPGGRRGHRDDYDMTTYVGVDAVLSADVDDAPMRRREYTAPGHGLDSLTRPAFISGREGRLRGGNNAEVGEVAAGVVPDPEADAPLPAVVQQV